MAILHSLVAVLSIMVARSAFGQVSASDFLPPAQGGTDQIAKPQEVEKSDGAVAAASAQDAFNAAASNDGIGSGMAKFPGGVGFWATGEASYRALDSNKTLARQSKRGAYVRAYLMAQAELAKVLSGSSSRSTAAANEFLDRVDTASGGKTNLSSKTEELTRSEVDFILDNAVLWKVQDVEGEGVVRVTVATSSAAKARLKRVGATVVDTDDLEAALDRVLADIKGGVIPPVGGFILTEPSSGEVVVVGFGCAVVMTDREASVQRRLNLNATRVARQRADASLCGLLSGQRSRWIGEVREAMKEEVKDFEAIEGADRLDPDGVKQLDERISTFKSRFQSADWWSQSIEGVLPPGVMCKTWYSEGNEYAYAVSVFMPSLSKAARGVAAEMSQGGASDSTGGVREGTGGDEGNVRRPDDKVRKGPSGERTP